MNVSIKAGQEKVITLELYVGQLKTTALIDTGASTSFVARHFVTILKQTPLPVKIRECELNLKLADENYIKTQGCTTLRIQLMNRLWDIDVHVVPQLAYPIILGCDFLRKHGATLSFTKGECDMTLTELLPEEIEIETALYVLEKREIPAYSQGFVSCSLSSNVKLEDTYHIIANNELFHNKGILVSHGLINFKKQPFLLVANTTNKSININADELLATLQPIDTDDELIVPVNVVENQKQATETTASVGKKYQSKSEAIEQIHTLIPKLDINFKPFTEKEVYSIVNTLAMYTDIFMTEGASMGAAKGVEHTIDTGSSRPISQPPRRLSPSERALIHEMTAEMLNNKVISPSNSPCSSPVV